ncbi:MAG: lipopolysaccharide biosynthesis protein [Clostridiales bacterium]|nr:lipopolysaccharide biosynthesis protein [Clostridiales bacterium]
MLSRFLIGKDTAIARDSFIYNTASGLINAAQSVLILMVISRVLGDYDAGVFNIAWAVGNLFLNVGKYGMREMQATDVGHKYSFKTYLNSRIISTAVMMAVSLGYIFYSAVTIGYETSKTVIIILVCLLKAIDSVEDIYQGQQQLNGRLDVAGKCYSIRLTVTIIAYVVTLFICKDLLIATAISLAISAVASIYLLFLTSSVAKGAQEPGEGEGVMTLFADCFRLFLATFLSFYMINAPKFAIDAQMSSEAQADYGYIAMPVFLIGVFGQFIYMPIIKGMADSYAKGDRKAFHKEMIKQTVYLVILTVLIMAGTYLLGIPLLSLFFHKDLTMYKTGLLILMAGGSLLAYSNFARIVLTIMRRQGWVIAAYVIGTIFEFCLAGKFIEKDGIFGGCTIFLYSMMVLTVIITAGMIICSAKMPSPKDIEQDKKA